MTNSGLDAAGLPRRIHERLVEDGDDAHLISDTVVEIRYSPGLGPLDPPVQIRGSVQDWQDLADGYDDDVEGLFFVHLDETIASASFEGSARVIAVGNSGFVPLHEDGRPMWAPRNTPPQT